MKQNKVWLDCLHKQYKVQKQNYVEKYETTILKMVSQNAFPDDRWIQRTIKHIQGHKYIYLTNMQSSRYFITAKLAVTNGSGTFPCWKYAVLKSASNKCNVQKNSGECTMNYCYEIY